MHPRIGDHARQRTRRRIVTLHDVGVLQLAEQDETITATAGRDVHDAVARIDALVLEKVLVDAFGFTFGIGELGDDIVGRRIEMEVIEDPGVVSRHEVPDIGFNGIIVALVVFTLGRIDVPEFHLREEIVFLPCRSAAKLDRLVLATQLVGAFAFGNICPCRHCDHNRAQRHQRQDRLPDDLRQSFS